MAPFTERHSAICRDGLGACARARELLDKGESCGKDCAGDRAILDALEQSLQGYEREFLLGSPAAEKRENT